MKLVGPVDEDGDVISRSSLDDVTVLTQQDGADTGNTIYVQFTGDSDPASPVRGDVRIKET